MRIWLFRAGFDSALPRVTSGQTAPLDAEGDVLALFLTRLEDEGDLLVIGGAGQGVAVGRHHLLQFLDDEFLEIGLPFLELRGQGLYFLPPFLSRLVGFYVGLGFFSLAIGP